MNPETADSSIERVLQEDACSFEFFQAVALLQRLWMKERQPVGQFSNPQDEAVRFRVNNTLAFPASQIQSIDLREGDLPEGGSPENEPREGQQESDAQLKPNRPADMLVNFMGLTGPMGVLPYCYTEMILERLKAKDGAFADFLDIFNHRMISFFYRAWEKYRFPATYYRGDDIFTHHLMDFIGLGTPGLARRQAVPDDALLHYAALLGAQARSAEALEEILNGYFEVPVEVEQFAGAWYRLDPSSQCSMADEDDDSDRLGSGVVVGDEIWDQQSRVRINVGPLTLAQYTDFLPGGAALEPLKSLVKFFSNDELDFEIRLILQREEVPQCEVGNEDDAGPRLGWVSWLKSVPHKHDPGDAILSL
ncbi:MAG TPA: type VI secretion system baseplate subunit TssG [Terriglobales bacterium]|nr:type VI secretion system baseplate subunit TssG [Terriglobales bacterium]